MNVRVLAVDDDPDVLAAYEEMLTPRGYEVATATNGMAGLQAIDDFAPDLILLDIKLPGLSGWDFLRMARLTPRGSEVPVVVISGAPLRQSVAPSLNLGASACVAKPFSVKDLLLLMERLVGPGADMPFHEAHAAAVA